MKEPAYMLIATNDMKKIRDKALFKDAHTFWEYRDGAGILGVEVEKGVDLPIEAVREAVEGHIQVLPEIGYSFPEVSVYVNEDTVCVNDGVGFEPCFLQPRNFIERPVLGNLVLFKPTKNGLSYGFSKKDIMYRLDLRNLFVCYKKNSSSNGGVDWESKGVDIAAYLRKKEFFPKKIYYSVVFTIKDKDKFMKGLGGQILDYMKEEASEEIGAVVDMVGLVDLTKYQRYAKFIATMTNSGSQGGNTPDFETWELAGEPKSYDRNGDYEEDLDQ